VFGFVVGNCAGMMELADIDVSKASARKGVRVRIPLPAQRNNALRRKALRFE
jgi:hypothetical protein